MIRFVLRRQRLDSNTRLKSDEYFTVESAEALENALRTGGSSENGYDYVSLLGVELLESPR